MIDEVKLKENFAKFCIENGLRNPCVDVQLYNIRENFFKENDTAWDKISETCGDWIRVDLDAWFKSDNPSVPDDLFITEEVYDSVNEKCWINAKEWTIQDEEDENCGMFNDELETQMYSELSEKMKADLDGWWNELELDEASRIEAVVEAIGQGDLEETYDICKFIDDLGYWTVFFEPDEEDIEAGFKSGLLPFSQDDVFMLGLGGCGQNMRPHLDCYQALTSNSLPANSLIFSDRKFFDNVSPVKSAEILEMCKRDTPYVVFSAFDKYSVNAKDYKFSFIGFVPVHKYSETEVEEDFADDIFSEIPEMTEMWEMSINGNRPCEFDGNMNTYAVSFYGIIKVKGNSEGHARDEFDAVIKRVKDLTVEEVMLEE
jgi:hypothetical protein